MDMVRVLLSLFLVFPPLNRTAFAEPMAAPVPSQAIYATQGLATLDVWPHRSFSQVTLPILHALTLAALLVIGRAQSPAQTPAPNSPSDPYALLDQRRAAQWRESPAVPQRIEDAAVLEKLTALLPSEGAAALLVESEKMAGRSLPGPVFFELVKALDHPVQRPWAVRLLWMLGPPTSPVVIPPGNLPVSPVTRLVARLLADRAEAQLLDRSDQVEEDDQLLSVWAPQPDGLKGILYALQTGSLQVIGATVRWMERLPVPTQRELLNQLAPDYLRQFGANPDLSEPVEAFLRGHQLAAAADAMAARRAVAAKQNAELLACLPRLAAGDFSVLPALSDDTLYALNLILTSNGTKFLLPILRTSTDPDVLQAAMVLGATADGPGDLSTDLAAQRVLIRALADPRLRGAAGLWLWKATPTAPRLRALFTATVLQQLPDNEPLPTVEELAGWKLQARNALTKELIRHPEVARISAIAAAGGGIQPLPVPPEISIPLRGSFKDILRARVERRPEPPRRLTKGVTLRSLLLTTVSDDDVFRLIAESNDAQTRYVALEHLADRNYDPSNSMNQYPKTLALLIRDFHRNPESPAHLLLLNIKNEEVRLHDALLETLLIQGTDQKEFGEFGTPEDLKRLANAAQDPRARAEAKRLLGQPVAQHQPGLAVMALRRDA